MEQEMKNVPSITAHFRAVLPNRLKEAAKLGHIHAMKQKLAPPVKIEQYRKLKFRIMQSMTPLPLGDSILVFQMDGVKPFKPFKPFNVKGDLVQAVYLPLSPSLVLVGTVNDQMPDLSLIPLAIAQCSLEYFISNSANSTNDDLHTHIGEYAYQLSQDEADSLLAGAMNG